jgi:hypothetical protein
MKKTWLVLGLIALAMPTWLVAQGAARPDGSADALAVADTLRAMYVAAVKDDLAGFHAITVPGFYAFDNGKRYDGDALMQMVMDAHARGVTLVWKVPDPDVHVFGDHAQIAYTNIGSIQTGVDAPVQPLSWLESAYLERRDGSWKIVFFQSERATVPAQ